MKAIRVENPGPDYRLVLQDIPEPKPGAGEILIKVAAAGLNHADLSQAKGNYPPPPGAPDTLGMEVSGEIAELGADVGDLTRRRQGLRTDPRRWLCGIRDCFSERRIASAEKC